MKTLQKYAIHLSALLWLLCLTTSSCTRFARPFTTQDKGGMYLIIGVKADPAQLDQNITRTMTVMQKRCEKLGVYCRTERLGGNQVKLYISEPTDPERIKKVLLAQGEGLELRAVISPPSPAPVQLYPTQEEAAAAAGPDRDVLPYIERGGGSEATSKKYVVVERVPVVAGQHVRQAEAHASAYDPERYEINFKLDPEGAQRFGEWTGVNINNYIAVVLNKEVRSVAFIKGQIFDEAQITGNFTKQQAEDVATVLSSGALPAPIEALEEGTYKP